VVEVDADRGGRRRVELEQRCRAARLALAGELAGLLGHEPPALKVGHERGDGRAREAGAAGQLGSAGGAAGAQEVHDSQAVELAEGAE
jgi:hypothetical protein